MKKLITLLLVLTGMVSTASATEYTVYFKPGSNWAGADATFKLNMKNSNDEWKTAAFTSTSYDGILQATYDSDYSAAIQFLRFSPDGNTQWNYSSNSIPAPKHSMLYIDPTGSTGGDEWTAGFYCIAANSTDIIDGSSTWNGSSLDNAMTVSDANTVSLTFTNKLLTAEKNYAYKVVRTNGNSWYPGSNKEFTVAKDGYYTITYTFNTSTDEVAAPTVTLTQEVEYRYGVQRGVKIGDVYDYTTLGYMTNVDGTPTLTVSPLDLTASTNLLYKISRDVFVGGVDQHASTWSWNSADGNVDGHYVYTPTLSGNHTVSFYYYPTSETTWTIGHKMDTEYYLVIQGTVNKDIPLTDTDGDGTYSATFNNQANKWMVLFPGYAYSDATTVNWDYSIRPHGDGNTTINFANNSGLIQVAGSVNWDVASTYSDYVTISFTPSTNTWSVAPYFEKNIYKAADGYATFSSDKAVAIPDGVTAKFTTSVTSGTINWTDIADGIPANEGALLYSAAAAASANDYETYKFTPATTTDNLTGNLMKPIATKTQLAQSTASETTNFILSKVADNLGFYKVNDSGSWCNAGTAYLQVANGNFSPARAFFLFDDDSNTTAIETVKKEQKMNGEYYNLAGQRVAQPTKGLYIVNGKKVIVK